MGEYMDITGQKYGRLTALYHTDIKRAGSGTYWMFQCDCGNKKILRSNVVRSGKTLSCGCLLREKHPVVHHEQRNLIGMRFGKLTVLSSAGMDKDGLHYLSNVKCDCGYEQSVRDTELVSGRKVMCRICARNIHKTHGRSKERVFSVWQGMMGRCYDKNEKAYPSYGGRGIKVCDEWHDSAKFIDWAIENGYDETKKGIDNSIDRIDVDGDYCPENCRWADYKTQSRNKRNTRYANYNGQILPIRDIADIVGIKATNIIQRMDKYGWSEYEAIHIPEGGKREKQKNKSV